MMSFDSSKYVDLPDWATDLRHLYWVIRVEGRIVEKEKLRLAELGVSQTKIAAVCRYLCSFKNSNTLRLVLAEPEYQLSLFSCVI